MPRVDTDSFALAGGLDLTTHRLRMPSGRARAMLNYVGKLGGGYRRIGGYEPYDGRARPSQQTYTVLESTAGLTGVAVGDTVTGADSGATGKTIEVLAGAPGYVAVTRVTGTFTDGETLRVGATDIGIYNDAAQITTLDGFADNRLSALVEAEYRASITAVPGEGAVLGAFEHKGTLYAIRNNVGSTAAVIHKESAAGWTAVALNEQVAFTDANTSVGEGDTLTQGGVTATVLRVSVRSGTLASGVNTGILVISSRSGGNFAAGAASSTGGGSLTLSGAQSAITLLPSGAFEFVEYNFTGSADTKRVYGCDGVNPGFEFDGTILVPIATGMTEDKPSHVFAHKMQLFFSFRGSVQHAAPGTPYVWSPITGAAEIAMGDTVTGFLGVPGSNTGAALMIFTSGAISVLYGNNVNDWNLVPFADKIGAANKSLRTTGNMPIFMDALGVTTASAAQEFGGFRAGVVTDQIEPLLKGRVDEVAASFVSRTNNQYVLLLNDKTGIVITFGRRSIECMTRIELEHQVSCTWETTRNGGEVFIGCSDGFVYQMDCGRSFAGSSIVAFCLAAFNHSKTPLTRKQYRRAWLEARGDSAFAISATTALAYDDVNVAQNDPVAKRSQATGGAYDIDNWDEIAYDGADTTSMVIPVGGFARNMSVGVYSESSSELPHELQGVLVNFTPRRLERQYG